MEGFIPKGLKRLIKKIKPDFVLSVGDLYGAFSRDILFKYIKKLKPGKYRVVGPEQLIKLIGEKRVKDIVKKEVNAGKRILNFLNSLDIPVFLVYGNADNTKNAPWSKPPFKDTIEDLVKKLKNITQLEYKKVKINGFFITGFGCKFPALLKSQIRYRKQILKHRKIEKNKLKKLLKDKNTIILTHEPPFGILDKIKDKRSHKYGQHVGDDVLLDAIKKYKPILSIFGHIHECQGKKKIGKTTFINAGNIRSEKVVLIDLPELKVKFIKL